MDSDESSIRIIDDGIDEISRPFSTPKTWSIFGLEEFGIDDIIRSSSHDQKTNGKTVSSDHYGGEAFQITGCGSKIRIL